MASVLGKMDTIDIRVRPRADLLDRDQHLPGRHIRVWRAIVVGESVADGEGVRGIDILDLPVTTGWSPSGLVMWYSTRPPGFSSCLVNVAG